MSDELKSQKKIFLPAIRQAKELPAEASVCAAAYKAIQDVDASLRVPLLKWFIKTAKLYWVKSQPSEDASAEKLFELLNQQAELPDDETFELLQKLKGNPQAPDSPVSLHSVTMDELSFAALRFKNLITGAIDLHFDEEYEPEEFYAKLWETLESLLAPCTESERGVCLQLVVRDSRMPYQKVLRGIHMEEEEYQKIAEAIMPQLQKMAYVLYLPTTQKTESASRILWILEELKNEKEKAVFLSSLMYNLKSSE